MLNRPRTLASAKIGAKRVSERGSIYAIADRGATTTTTTGASISTIRTVSTQGRRALASSPASSSGTAVFSARAPSSSSWHPSPRLRPLPPSHVFRTHNRPNYPTQARKDRSCASSWSPLSSHSSPHSGSNLIPFTSVSPLYSSLSLLPPTLPYSPPAPAVSRPGMKKPDGIRKFHTSQSSRTDGVFAALTSDRAHKPWITALEEKRKLEAAAAAATSAPDSASSSALQNSAAVDTGREEMLRRRAEAMKKPKRMTDSYHRVVLPLAQDPMLSDIYLNASGHIRLGSLFMDLDALAGIICYKHTGNDPSVANVTAAFDRIAIKHPIQDICDLELSGKVTYASGRSSMEISLQVARLPADRDLSDDLNESDEEVDSTGAGRRIRTTRPEDILLESTCTMVALDAITKKPINVSPLLIETDEERRLSKRGEENSRRKKQLRETDLTVHTPNDEESELIHRIWKKRMTLTPSSLANTLSSGPVGGLMSSIGPPDSFAALSNADKPHSNENGGKIVFMDSTKLQNTSIMQPQYRNRHQYMIFGGFLLKQTFELAFCCAASFGRTRPSFLSLDPSTFRNPVPVGSVLYLTARVAYTDPQVVPDVEVNGDGKEVAGGHQQQQQHHLQSQQTQKRQTKVQVRVDSFVRDIEHADADAKPTGTFNYTFLLDRDIRVLPQTYSEYVMYLDARRRAKMAAEQEEEGQEQ